MVFRLLHLVGFGFSVFALISLIQWVAAPSSLLIRDELQLIREVPLVWKNDSQSTDFAQSEPVFISFPDSIFAWQRWDMGFEMKQIQDFEAAVEYLWGAEGIRMNPSFPPEIKVYTASFLFEDVVSFMVARDHELVVFYRPKLAIGLMSYGEDDLAIDIDTLPIEATRFLPVENPNVQELAKTLRERNCSFLGIHKGSIDAEEGWDEIQSIPLSFPYGVYSAIPFDHHNFSRYPKDELEWKMKGLLYETCGLAFETGYAVMVIGSSIRELEGLARVLDGMGTMPVHFARLLEWEKSLW